MKKILNYNILNYINYLSRVLYIYIESIKINYKKNNIDLYVKNTSDIEKIIYFLQKHTNSQFVVLSDLFGVDNLRKKNRFQVIYALLSIRYNARIRINIYVNEFQNVPSITKLFNSAGWLERETWDMFGIFFVNNQDLRRILTDYGFDGFPLRKDFPLSGYIELRYDDSLKRVVYEPIEITQEFRFFDFKSPWEQIKNMY